MPPICRKRFFPNLRKGRHNEGVPDRGHPRRRHRPGSDSGRAQEAGPFDAIYFGAVGFPTVPDDVSLHGLRLPICQGFDQYANLRPSLLLPGVSGPLRDKAAGEIDFVVVRENTEGEYVGAGGLTAACPWR